MWRWLNLKQMIQKIKKGNHYCWPRRFGIAPKIYTLKFTVDKSWWYPNINEDSKDVNKLGGHSLGFHKKNAVRLGYVPVFGSEAGWVRLYHYETLNWEASKDKYFLDFASVGDEIEMKRYDEDIVYFRNGSLIGSFGHPENGLSYWLSAYHGGNNTAPHDIFVKSVIV